MPNLYEHLQSELGDENDASNSGLTPFDLTDLPETQRRVMLFVLRRAHRAGGSIDRQALSAAIADRQALAEALDVLVRRGWLIARGEPPNQHYSVNFRRKRASRLNVDLWTTLSERLADDS